MKIKFDFIALVSGLMLLVPLSYAVSLMRVGTVTKIVLGLLLAAWVSTALDKSNHPVIGVRYDR